MPIAKPVIFGLIFLMTFKLFSQSSSAFKEVNLNYLYDISNELLFTYQPYFEHDSVTVFFSLTFNEKPSVSWMNEYQFSIRYREDYDDTNIAREESLSLQDYFFGKRKDSYFYKYKIQLDDNIGLAEFVVQSEKLSYEQVYEINLDEDRNYENDHIMMYSVSDDLPILENYILTGQKVKFNQFGGGGNSLWAYYYDTEFDIAVPPMILDNNNVSRSLNIANTISIPIDSSVIFEGEGLYFVQSDTSSLKGLAFRVQAPPYPKFGTYENLIKPLKFISTKEESNVLALGNDLQASFETYWFELTSSQNLARNVIKDFYDRVYEANFYFTSYKEGWRTDMGMIYIIYGNPDRVFKHEEYEEWIYNQNVNMPAIRFTFVKIKNVFSDNHYTLVRDRKFDKHWFRAVELWRSGKK